MHKLRPSPPLNAESKDAGFLGSATRTWQR